MKYYRYLYSSDSIKHVDKLKIKLNLRKGIPGVYILAFGSDSKQLEIINSLYLKLNYYRKHPPVVVGICKSYDEAVDMVIKIVNESYQKTGNCSIRDYLIKRAKTRDFTI